MLRLELYMKEDLIVPLARNWIYIRSNICCGDKIISYWSKICWYIWRWPAYSICSFFDQGPHIPTYSVI